MAYLLPGFGLIDDVGGLLPGQGNVDLTAEAESGTTVTGTLETLTLTEFPAIVNDKTLVTGTLETLTLTEHQATVSTGINVTGTLETLTLTEFPATITTDINVTGTLETLTLTQYQATITEGSVTHVTGTLETLTLTEYPAVITYTLAVYASLETLTLSTFKADISYTSLDTEETSTGGFNYPSPPSKKEVRKQREKLGIVEPEKIVKRVKKLTDIKLDHSQLKSLEQAEKKQAELQRLQRLHNQVKRRGEEKAQREALDKQVLQRINDSLIQLEIQKKLIEEQDIVFVMMMLAA